MKQSVPAHCKSKHRVRVRFGETDLMGIVHHGTYISYFEVGRVEYMRRRGLDYHSWTELGIHLPVVEAYVRYRRTARFDELLCIETRLTELSRVKVRFDYRLLREPEGEMAVVNPDDQLVAEGHTLLACVDQHHIPRRIPREAEAVLLGPELDIPVRIGADGRPRHAAVAPGHSGEEGSHLGSPSERVAGSKS
ncbi:MAG TPA: thioesterase family protein [Polyangiaceae bacterium]|nr:thioesterase family protein [Polyangiaceae bacterium]